MRKIALIAVLATGCARAELFVSPSALDWGEVDFHQDRPANGYDAVDMVLRNDGKRDVDIVVTRFDDFHLVLGAAQLDSDPWRLPTLEPATQAVLTVGVWDYDLEGGERESEVTGTFVIDANGLRDPIEVDWSFIPVRNIGDDTGATLLPPPSTHLPAPPAVDRALARTG